MEHWKMVVFFIKSLASNNCFSHINVFWYGVNTLSKMIFCEKTQNFVQIGPYDFFFQISISISNGKIKWSTGKSIFAVNLPLKLFRATVANADIGIVKSLRTFLETCLYHMLVKFEQNHIVQTTQNFELFDKKPGFFWKKKLTKRWRHFALI